MVTLDRIRLTGLLRRSPAPRGASLRLRRRGRSRPGIPGAPRGNYDPILRTICRSFALLAAAVAVGATTAAHGAHPLARTAGRLVPAPRSLASVSINWAGYVANGASFSDVRATWTQPAVRCLDPSGRRISSSSGFWIGLGGASFSSAGLEQT